MSLLLTVNISYYIHDLGLIHRNLFQYYNIICTLSTLLQLCGEFYYDIFLRQPDIKESVYMLCIIATPMHSNVFYMYPL